MTMFWETNASPTVADEDGGVRIMNPVPGGTHLVDELVGSRELARATGFILNPRCRICRHDPLRTKVNGLLAFGASYAMILRSLEDTNSELDKRDRVTIDSIRNHTARHFPVQHIARATYRDILERRAKENGVDFVKAVATAITPMAFYETVMAKGYETSCTRTPRWTSTQA